MKKLKRTLCVLLLVMEGIPLLLYPLVLIADIMTFAGEGTWKENILLSVIVITFLAVSSSYPLTYVLSVIYYFKKHKRNCGNMWVPVAPLIHLGIFALLYYFWSISE